jgi:type VI secretion system protein ImpA
MFDFGMLTQPVSAGAPCGPDLDLDGDSQYLNFFAAAEQALPKSYFENIDSNGELKRFDPKTINLEANLTAAKPLLARTRDLRLTILLAKISILGRDLDSFINCLKAIALLLDEYWEGVHPRGEEGDFSYRQAALEAIDALPTVVNPLQFQPLVENRRYGPITYRVFQIAKGEISPGEGEAALDLGTIERILNETELAPFKATTSSFVELAATVERIKTLWNEKSKAKAPLNLDRLSDTVGAIAVWLKGIVNRRDPGTVEADATSDVGLASDDSSLGAATTQSGGLPRLVSAAAAVAALQAAADYFARSEPSNPALLLIRQAQQMVGKSFVEVMRMMVPAHMETATINIGRDRFFDLPIERMATLVGDLTPQPAAPSDVQAIVFNIENRGQALILLDQIAGFFRISEPSSPVPFLIDKARELAQRDFISLLRDVLPDGTLKTTDNQG